MAYNGTRPADNDPLNISASIIRDNFEGLRKDGIVIAKPPFYGVGVPAATLGEVGEQYFDTATGDQYLKTASGWTLRLSMAVKADQAALDAVLAWMAAPTEQIQEIGTVAVNTSPFNYSLTVDAGNIITVAFAPAGTGGVINLSFIVSGEAITGTCRVLTLVLSATNRPIIVWPNNIKWSAEAAPSLTDGGTDIITLISLNNHARWLGMHSGSFVS